MSIKLQDNETLRQALSRLKKELKTDRNLSIDSFDVAEGLSSDDAKTRKNAALLILDLKKLGMVDNEPEIIEKLFASYEKEEILFVRPSLLEALTGFKDSISEEILNKLSDRLQVIDETSWDESEEKHIQLERHEILLILSKEDIKVRKVSEFTHPFEVLLTCDKEFAEQIAADLGSGSRVIASGVRAKVAKKSKILKNRLFQKLLFLVPIKKGYVCSASSVGEIAKQTAIIRLLDDLFEEEEKSSKYKFRLSIESEDKAFDGKELKRICNQIEADSKGRLVNDPSDYEIVIVFKAKRDGNFSIYVEVPSIDNRFAYRIHTEPTSMSTHLAAETVNEIKEYIKPESWIIDPFCGTGTLLLERALKMPSREYYGIDTYGEAIKEARINAEAAGVKVNFINRNFFDFTSDYPFQEIIAEFPDLFGKEPKEKNSFYESFFRKAIEIADEGAIMFLVSEEENLIKKHIRLSSNLKLIRSKHLGKSKSIYIIGVEK